MAEDDQYTLSDERNEALFHAAIVPDELAHATPQDQPRVVFLVAQQGAGKTRTAAQLGAQLNTVGGYVKIDSDVYKTYHPDWTRLLHETDATSAAAHTALDGQRWHNKAQQYARDQLFHVLIEETTQNPPYFAEVVQGYRDAGYQVELVFLGVPEAMSRQGILHRYHEQVLDRGHGRLTVPEKRDRAFQGMLETADLLDERHLADKIVVLRRGEAEPRYSNELTSEGQWQAHARTRDALNTERERPWTLQESADFVRIQQRLSAELGTEWRDELTRIDDLAHPLMLAGVRQEVMTSDQRTWSRAEQDSFDQVHAYLLARTETSSDQDALRDIARTATTRVSSTRSSAAQAARQAGNALTRPSDTPPNAASPKPTTRPSPPPQQQGQQPREDGPSRGR